MNEKQISKRDRRAIRRASKARLPMTWLCLGIAVLFTWGDLSAQQWKPFEGESNLKSLFTNTKVTWNNQRGEYCADGTGILFAYGTIFPRTWMVKNDKEVCVNSEDENVCYLFEQNTYDRSEYRVLNVTNNERTVIQVMPGGCGSDVSSGPLFQDWEAITDDNEVRQIFENKVYQWENGRGEYCADGTGTVFAYNGEFPRTWTVKDGGYCISTLFKTVCYSVEKHVSDPELFREKDLTTGQYAIFRLSAKAPASCND